MDSGLLLLKYKLRNCYCSQDLDIDNNTGMLSGSDIYEKEKWEIWQLQLPDCDDPMMDKRGNIKKFHRFEYYTIGDVSPIVVFFQYQEGYRDEDKIGTCKISSNYKIVDWIINWHDFFKSEIRPILHEYERFRGDWQPRIIIEKQFVWKF